MTKDFAIDPNVSLNLIDGNLRAFQRDPSSPNKSSERIHGIFLEAKLEKVPQGFSFLKPERIRRGSVTVENNQSKVIYDDTEDKLIEESTPPIAILYRVGNAVEPYIRPTSDIARRMLIGKDELGYFVSVKEFVKDEHFANHPGLHEAFETLQPLDMPIAIAA